MTKKPVYKRWWFILIAVLIVIGAIGAAAGGDDEEGKTDEPSSQTQQEQSGDENKSEDEEEEDENLVDGFEIMGEFSEERDSFSLYITGKVKNKKGRELSYAQIIFNLYDKDGAQIGTAVDNINNVKEDGVWKFKAIALENAEDVASWELDSIDSF